MQAFVLIICSPIRRHQEREETSEDIRQTFSIEYKKKGEFVNNYANINCSTELEGHRRPTQPSVLLYHELFVLEGKHVLVRIDVSC